MKAVASISVLLIVLFLQACGFADNDVQYHVPQDRLPGSWVHAYEKDCGINMVFMPYEDDFLTTWRVRNRLELRTDGTAAYTLGTPDDPYILRAPVHVEGHWAFDPEGNRLQIFHPDGSPAFGFEVRHVCPMSMKLAYLEWAQPGGAR